MRQIVSVHGTMLYVSTVSRPQRDEFIYLLNESQHTNILWSMLNQMQTPCADFFTVFFFQIHRLSLTWKSPFGYLLTWFIESAAVFCALLPILPMICLSIGLGWLFMAILNEITNDLSVFKVSKVSTFKRRRHEFKMHLYKIIQLHSYLKELSFKLC